MSEPSQNLFEMDASSTKSWIPKVGMVFETDEKAYHFYCFYGKEMGFGVRRHLVKRRPSGVIYCRVFACFKEGHRRASRKGPYSRPDERTGCMARMAICIMEDGKFHVSEFEPNHNHELMANVSDAPDDLKDDAKVAAKVQKKHAGGQAFRPSTTTNNIMAKKYFHYDIQGMQDHQPSLEPEETQRGINSANGSLVPTIGMEFEDDEEAYHFYINYASREGFSIRKHLVKKRTSGVVYSRLYVCHKEGYTRNRGGPDSQHRRPKPYDRTGCPASMLIKITKNGRYRVTEFEEKHNHPLVLPAKTHLFRMLRRGSIRSEDGLVDPADDSGMSQEPSKGCSDGPASSQQSSLPFLGAKKQKPSDGKNFMRVGDVGAMMQYLQEKQLENPSFFYDLKLNQDDRITNIFWSDVKSMVDFDCFGDVVCLDTTYKTSGNIRPFALFIGVNHHKQAIVFGTTIMYDESAKSFKWLFETFRTAMCGKQPKVILTDDSRDIIDAIAAVWPGTVHRFCPWHMYQNASRHLNSVFLGSTTFAKDFSYCVYDCEEEDEFQSEWKNMLEKYDLFSNEWLAKLYEDRDKWASAYGRETFCADIKDTLTMGNISGMLNASLDLDLLDILKHYEGIIGERRLLEVQSDIRANQSVLKVPTARMLRQAIHAYTPAVYKIFQREFELSMDCMVYNSGQMNNSFEFKVLEEEKPKEYLVRFESSDSTISCSCKKFECMGIQCRHVLKALDMINVKELDSCYILKRWSKNAKGGNLQNNHEFPIEGYTKLSIANRHKNLHRIFDKIAVRAAESEESYELIESLSDHLLDQACQILRATPPDKTEA